MPENLSLGIQITLVGMGLVFAAILLLWAVMAALVWLARDRQPPAVDAEPAHPGPAAAPPEPDRMLKRKAAAIAVAVALARQAEAEAHTFTVSQPEAMGAWQTVTRARQLNQRGTQR